MGSSSGENGVHLELCHGGKAGPTTLGKHLPMPSPVELACTPHPISFTPDKFYMYIPRDMHKSIHSSAVSISPKPETTQMAVDGRMNKLWDSLRMQNNSAVKMCELAV